MSKSLELALCDTQGQLFEMSGEQGVSSEAFIKAYMTSEIAKDMDSEFDHVQWAGKAYIYPRMEDECESSFEIMGDVYDKETLYWMAIFIVIGIFSQAKAVKRYISKHQPEQ